MDPRKAKTTVALLILISFLMIGIFGFAFMGHGEGHVSQNCILAVEKTTCSKTTDPLTSAFFHLNALKNFSLGAFPLMVLIVGVIFLSFESLRRLTLLVLPPGQVRYRTQKSKALSFPERARFLRWLSLRQKTDSF